MYGCVIIRKVIGHGLNLLFNPGQVRPFLGYYKTLPGMFLPGGQLGGSAALDSLHRLRYRNRILPCVFHPADPADGVGMALADAFAPEGIILAFRKDHAGI